MSNNTTTKDITGQKFGRWTVVKRTGTRTHTKSKPALWEVVCVCGNTGTIAGTDLRSGRSQGCGCLKKRGGWKSSYKGDKHHCWSGGRSIDRKGYVHLCRSLVRELYPDAVITTNKGMFEHRAVMSHFLKRKLLSNETVHHKNGNRADNRIENLELRSGNHGPGQSKEELVEWAKEILKFYS